MRKTLYKWLRRYLRPETEIDYDLNQWVDGKLLLGQKTQESYQQGYEDCENKLKAQVEQTKQELNEQYSIGQAEIESRAHNKAMILYSSDNWVVNPLHVFQVVENTPFIGQYPATKKQAKDLQAEARVLMSMKLWKLFQETLRQKAIEKSVLQSDTSKPDFTQQVLGGKMMVNNLKVIELIVDYLDKLDTEKMVDGLTPKKVV